MRSARSCGSYLTVWLFLIVVPAAVAQAKYAGGSGTEADPYQIASMNDLILLGESSDDYGMHFVLTRSISLAARTFSTAVIAADLYPSAEGFQGEVFTGSFDGRGYRIRSLTVDSDDDFAGLFGWLGSEAQVRHLTLTGGVIRGEARLPNVVQVGIPLNRGTGSLAAVNQGLVSDCHSSAEVSGIVHVGGLVGENNGIIEDCSCTAAVVGTDRNVGGLVGQCEMGIIRRCFSTGAITGTASQLGGLLGYLDEGIVSHCYSWGSVSGRHYVGGLVGYNRGSVFKSYSIGRLRGSAHVGGLIGAGPSGTVQYCFWDRDSSQQGGSDGGAALTRAEIQNPAIVGLNGFGDDPNWVQRPYVDYPRLQWEGVNALPIHEPTVTQLNGDGTAEDPYLIESVEDLYYLSKVSLLWNGYVQLSSHIDLDPAKPDRFVFEQAVLPSFGGVFDANGYTISNLWIQGNHHLGLFGRLEPSAVVRDLRLKRTQVEGSGSFVALLVGQNDQGIIINCATEGGEIQGESSHVGALVGENRDGSLVHCSSSSSIRGGYAVGGLAGSNKGSIVNCYSLGPVHGEDRVGGLVGYNEMGVIANTYSVGGVSGPPTAGESQSLNIGRLVGKNHRGTISHSFYKAVQGGSISSDGGVGLETIALQDPNTYREVGWDMVGDSNDGTADVWNVPDVNVYPTLRYLWAMGSGQGSGRGTASDPFLVRTSKELGMLWYQPDAYYRLAADLDLSGIVWSTAVVPVFSGKLDGAGYQIRNLNMVGGSSLGLIGSLATSGELINLDIRVAKVTGDGSRVGTLVGANKGSVMRCICEGRAEGAADYVGGLVGLNQSGTVLQCASSVSVNGGNGIGGLVGASRDGILIESFSTGSVKGTVGIGGLVGDNSAVILDCYSRSPVEGMINAAGLVGFNAFGSITNCYSMGSVSGLLGSGGLIGNDVQGTTQASLWDIDTSGVAVSAGGIGLSTAELHTAEPYRSADWDFSEVWQICEGDYPRLVWEAIGCDPALF